MARDYKVRMASEVAEATSANVSAWLEEALASGKRLAPDPGAGPELIGFRVDSEKVVELANKMRERVPVVLRRLIATHVNLPPREDDREGKSAGAAAAEMLPDKVLPAKLAYSAEDMLPIVKGMDKGLAVAYRRIYGLKELPVAQTAEEDRDLASAMAECANRRSPKWLIENADLAKLTVSLVRWTMAQTDDLEKAAGEKREKKLATVPAVQKTETSAAAAALVADELTAHSMADVQREGEF